LLLLVALSGCADNRQSTLAPHSGQSHRIDNLWWGMLAAATVVFLGTLAMLFLAWARRNREGLPVAGADSRAETRLVVVFGIVVPVVALVTLFFVADIGVVRATDAPTRGQTKMTVDVVGRQWFWEVRYPGTNAVTANEIHIPVNTPVEVRLTTDDVIHSFWVPELGKKVDTVPGHPNTLELEADKPGVYRGQCAEFCGLQHANMAMSVYADPPAAYRAWLANMARPLGPAAPGTRAGLQAFTANQCASCHTLRGTSAHGRIGPDLTHVGSRKSLAALTLPNTRADLTAWIRDPQRFKPGNRMPGLKLSDRDLQQLVTFLEGLK
jgi:cytochrome c oxidase subunit 2